MFHQNRPSSDWQNIKKQAGSSYSVFGIFETREDKDAAVEKLCEKGFTREDILETVPDQINTFESEYKKNKKRIHRGSILLSIFCSDSDKMNGAKKLLEVSGAQDIASSSDLTTKDQH